MSDIVERLRRTEYDDLDACKSADEIECLRAEVAALKEALQHDAEPVAYLEPDTEHPMCCHKDEIDDEVKEDWIPLCRCASPQPTKEK